MDERYFKNEDLIYDASFFDPRNFTELKKIGFNFPEGSIKNIANLARVDVVELQSELIQFAQNYDVLSESVILVSNNIGDEVDDYEDENYSNKSVKCAVSENLNCKLCINCAMKCIFTLVTHSSSFSNVYLGYKFILSLSFTQVSCERSFSILKNTKTRLRSLSDDKLEAFMFMSLERKVEIRHDEVIDKLCASSNEFKRLLME